MNFRVARCVTTINPCRAGGAGAASTAIGLAGTHP